MEGGFDFSSFEIYHAMSARTYDIWIGHMLQFISIGEILIKERGYILNKELCFQSIPETLNVDIKTAVI